VQYDPITMKCMRCDFNEFMLDVHQPIHAYKKEHPRGS
jgi:predicted ATPase